MFDWYQNSAVCYVFLTDLDASRFDHGTLEDSQLSLLFGCRWFTRGWTLPELIAPPNLTFYDSNFAKLATRHQAAKRLEAVLGIDESLLVDDRTDLKSQLSRISVARRMSWAANRELTRPEDVAYCLVGIFDVYMSIEYGEGGKNAFFRLQQEINNRFVDHSLLAWTPHPTSQDTIDVLADHPLNFAPNRDVVADHPAGSAPKQQMSNGISIEARLLSADQLSQELILTKDYNITSGVSYPWQF